MRVFVDGEPIDLVPGSTVRHALLRADATAQFDESRRVFDPWGNEVGLDGELSKGDRFYTRGTPGAPGAGTGLA